MVENLDVRTVDFEELLVRHERLLYKIAQQWRGISGWEFEDLMQELRIVLWKAQQTYDPGRPPSPGRKYRQSFQGYLVFCCQALCQNKMRDTQTSKVGYTRVGDQESRPILLPLQEALLGGPSGNDPDLDLVEWMSNLSDEAQQVGQAILLGNRGPKSWGRVTGLSKTQIARARAELREAMRVAGLGGYREPDLRSTDGLRRGGAGRGRQDPPGAGAP